MDDRTLLWFAAIPGMIICAFLITLFTLAAVKVIKDLISSVGDPHRPHPQIERRPLKPVDFEDEVPPTPPRD